MKLIQRIGLTYFRIKFKVLEFVSVSKAAKEAFQLFCTPYSKRRTYEVPHAFANSRKLFFDFDNHRIQGFNWKPEKSNGSKLLICHGFDSNSYRFEGYIKPFLQEGFEVF